MVLKQTLQCSFSLLIICCLGSARSKTPIYSKENEDVDRPSLTIQDGTILGRKATTIGLNKTYYAFQGIPYAQPPIGNFRFKVAVRNLRWKGVLDTTRDKDECVQSSNPPTGNEDCLYINVYTPSLKRNDLTVMVWIYGGFFMNGNASYTLYGPDYLLDNDVVFVSFNYRQGIFGLLSTEDLECPGNLALKDQILALKWVQNNIEYFGGDPRKVTVFGESSGAASTSYLLQTNLTKGLFRAAIMESGLSLCFWALERRARETAFAIGKALKVNTTNSRSLVEGLRQIDVITLQNVAYEQSLQITEKNPLVSIQFAPVQEPYHEGAVIYNNSEELLSQGSFHRVPTIMGFNSNEAAIVGTIQEFWRLYLLKYDLLFTDLVPIGLTKSTVKKVAAAADIRLFYFGVLPIFAQTDSVIKFASDVGFNRAIRHAAMLQSKYATTYVYKFSFEGVLGGHVNKNLKGVGHSEELGYIFRRYNQGYAAPKSDTHVRSMMAKLWTNFAKFTNPTPQEEAILQNVAWLPSNTIPNNLLYLNVDKSLEIKLNPFNREMEFWDQLYKKYGDPPFNTY